MGEIHKMARNNEKLFIFLLTFMHEGRIVTPSQETRKNAHETDLSLSCKETI